MSESNSPGTLVLLPTYAHERGSVDALESRLCMEAKSLGFPAPFQVLRRVRASDLTAVFVVTDSLARLGTTPLEALKWLATALEKQITLYVPDRISLRPDTPGYEQICETLQSIIGVSRERRSLKTKESLFLAKARGVQVGRTPVSSETMKAVLRVYDTVGSVRGTARKLQEAGIKISKTAVGRIVADHRKGGSSDE